MNIYSEFHPPAIQPTFVTLFDNIVSVEIVLRSLKAESAEIKNLPFCLHINNFKVRVNKKQF